VNQRAAASPWRAAPKMVTRFPVQSVFISLHQS
jgi:hypothetical protein